MNVLKKKYMFVQTFSGRHRLEPETLLCLHHGCDATLNTGLLDHMAKSRLLFPHYGFSFYENPPGRVIAKGHRDRPAFFRSNRLHNLGQNSLVKTLMASDMFSDQGLAFYRPLSFLMFIGAASQLRRDVRCMDIFGPDHPDHPAARFFSKWEGWGHASGDEPEENDVNPEAMAGSVGQLDFESPGGYADCVYLLSDVMTSIVLSHVTVRQLIERPFPELVPYYQVPVETDAYRDLLSTVFQYDGKSAVRLDGNGVSWPLCGISPGIFGFGDVVFDVARRTLSGRRHDLVRFILELNRHQVLDPADLRYLV